MTTLHDRLADLADTAPRALPEPDLWGRGRRYRRRRRIAGATLALAGTVAVASGLLAWDPSGGMRIEPAGAGTEPRLPDRLYHPDPWAPGIGENGPIGRLVAVVGAPRDSWSNLDMTEFADVAGVNANGEYVFLDLEDRVGDDLELSADGRFVAYWYAGDPAGSEESGSEVADGVAVLDAETGRTRRHAVETPLGLDPQQLSWADDRLWVPLWPYDERTASGSSSRFDRMLTWDQSETDPVVVDDRALGSVEGLPAVGDELVDVRGRRLMLIAPDASQRVVARVRGAEGQVHLDPTGSRIASLRSWSPEGSGGEVGPADLLVIGAVGASPETVVTLDPLPGLPADFDRIVGWRNENEIVAHRWSSDGASYVSVDVTTGTVTTLVRLPSQTWSPGDRVATDALAAAPFAAPEPPDLRDPRVVALAGLGGALVLALGGLVLWRRRVRA